MELWCETADGDCVRHHSGCVSCSGQDHEQMLTLYVIATLLVDVVTSETAFSISVGSSGMDLIVVA